LKIFKSNVSRIRLPNYKIGGDTMASIDGGRIASGRQLWSVVEPYVKEALSSVHGVPEAHLDHIHSFNVYISVHDVSVIEGVHRYGSFTYQIPAGESVKVWQDFKEFLGIKNLHYVQSMYLDAEVRPRENIPTMSIKFIPRAGDADRFMQASDGSSDLIYKDYDGNRYFPEDFEDDSNEDFDEVETERRLDEKPNEY
jgi:hypothetical protein